MPVAEQTSPANTTRSAIERNKTSKQNPVMFLWHLQEIAEELGLLSDSSEEEILTTRVVRRRVIIQVQDWDVCGLIRSCSLILCGVCLMG